MRFSFKRAIRGILGVIALGLALPAGAGLDLWPWLTSGEELWESRVDPRESPALKQGRFRPGNPARSTGCRIGDLPVAETLLAFDENQRLLSVRLLVATRGDSAGLDEEQFERIRAACENLIREWAGKEGGPVEEQRIQHAVWARRQWSLPHSDIQLVWSHSRRHQLQRAGRTQIVDARPEFVRIDISPAADAAPELPLPPSVARQQEAAERDRLVSGLANRVVRRSNGDVIITGVPMVDQGSKGYCAVATIARMLQFYDLPADQHEIAQLANADPVAGTDPARMMHVLRRSGSRLGITARSLMEMDSADYRRMIESYNRLARRARERELPDSRFVQVARLYSLADADRLREVRTGQRGDYQRFRDTVRDSINAGIPLAWSLVLGIVPEEGRTPQTSGGHMRLIIGYNDERGELIFSDSWGAMHEAKRILTDNAWAVTTGLFAIEPR